MSDGGVADARLAAVQRLHKPRWDNCINACCSGEQCKHRSQVCEHDYDEWPCATAQIVYSEGVSVVRGTTQ